MQELDQDQILSELTTQDYKYGFTTDVETYVIEKGLNEDVITHISEMKEEPEWLLEFPTQIISSLADNGNARLGTFKYS